MSELFRDQLKTAIEASELTRYAIACKAKVDNGALSKFLAGKRGLSLDAVDRLVELLGLELQPRRKFKRKND
jgi:transcriptional regulator with XRE-family HTH domain